MGKINVLDKHVAELIAAGEVVERPCSVIKELVENSIDAGARNVTVEIKNGGVTYMRVTDDGSGILKEDIKKAFLKNATSKILKKDDLDTICTLGFRGEALASVCVVSKVELITKETTESLGSRYEIEGGEEVLFEDFGCPDGTTIIVKDLFYNVPARMKFLKKDISEANSISKLLDRISLSHPDVKFKFIRDNKEILNTPGDGKIDSAIYSVYGKEFASSLIPVEYSLNSLSLKGFISKPSFSRPNRNMQHFFINGRYVRTKTAMAALEEAFKGSIMIQKFPSCVLYINIPFNSIDVNVHPSKMEVRFVDERPIFQLVYHGVKSSLLENDKKNPISQKKSYESNLTLDKRINVSDTEILKKNEALKNSNLKNEKNSIFDYEPEIFIPKANNFGTEKPELNVKKNFLDNLKNVNDDTFSFSDSSSKSNLFEVSNFYKKDIEDTSGENLNSNDNLFEASNFYKNDIEKTLVKEVDLKNDEFNNEDSQLKLDNGIDDRSSDYKLIGEVFNTYIIVELKPNKLLFIDKHAAHERIIYEKLKKDNANNYSQSLIEPIAVTLDKDEYDAILNNKDIFSEAGFEIDDFGVGSVIVRAAPMLLDNKDVKSIVIEMSGYILENKKDIKSSYIEWLYDNVACRSAIKAGKPCTKEEMLALVKKLEKEDVRYCPHGRPIFINIEKNELEKKFFRK